MEDQILKHVCKFCKKKFACGRSLGGHIRCHLPKPDKSRATSSLRLIKVDQGNATRLSLAGSNSHSSTSDVVVHEDQEEEVDIALCLIMLSKDVGPWGGGKIPQNKNSKKKRKRGKTVQVQETVFTAVKSKHDEKFISVVDCPFPNPDEEQFELSECYGQIVTEKHECSIVGGHKRSHLLAYYTETSSSSENREMIDLNLPPAVIVQEESNNTVTTPHWWVENPHKHESLLSLIS